MLRRWTGGLLIAALLAASSPAYGKRTDSFLSLEPVGLHDEGPAVRNLQQLLTALEFYDGPVSGVFDESTRRALMAFQVRYHRPVSGEADAATLAGFGLDVSPRFWYEVQAGDTLSEIAARFGSSVPWLLRFNPHITSMHHIRQGQLLLVPIDFPLPDEITVKRIEALPNRFLGSYEVRVPFAEIGELMAWYEQTLRERGFETSMHANPVDGMTLRNRGVILGRISFSAADADGVSQMDVGLLFTDDGGEAETLSVHSLGLPSVALTGVSPTVPLD